jgi:glucan 1,3-beta-glucosidase
MPMPMHRHLLLVPLALLPVVITTRHGDAATTAATEAPAAACSTWYERTAHSTTGVWRSVQDPRFGAKGDGVTDDTAAIQKALDYRKDDNSLKISPQKTWGQPYPPGNCSYGDCQLYQKAPSIVYLPPGRYVISDTLVLLFHTHLVGNFRCPPTIVLKPSSRGFTNRSFGLKPAIAAANGFNSSLHNWWNSFGTPGNPAKRSGGENMVFFTQILHLRLEIGAGNSAATGIMWGVAQQTTIRDVEIEGGPAAVGLDISGKSNYAKTGPQGVGVGGGGTIEDIQIRGAEVGLKIASSQWALRGITLSGAASVGILGEQNTNVQFVDLDVSHTPLGIHLSSGLSYVILDSSFRAISGGTAISTSRPIFLENVTTDASIKSLVNKAGPVGLHRTEAYWQGAAYLHGTHSPHSSGIVAASRMRRVSRPRPTFETVSGKDPANLLSFGAKGDGIQDDTEAFVRAIAAADVVFVPWGLFRVTDTLQLRSRTKLVGEGLAHIWLGNYSSGKEAMPSTGHSVCEVGRVVGGGTSGPGYNNIISITHSHTHIHTYIHTSRYIHTYIHTILLSISRVRRIR